MNTKNRLFGTSIILNSSIIRSTLIGIALFPHSSSASIEIWESGEYSESFDSLPNTGTSNSAQPWTDDQTLRGWYLDSALSGAINEIHIGPHSSNGSSIYMYSFGSPLNDTDRALGATQTSTSNNHFAFGLLFQNQSGGVVTFNQMHYWGEQYRYSGQVSQSNITSYRISDSPISSPSAADSEGWILLPALDFASPVHSGNNPDSLNASTVTNGNESNYRTYVSGDLSNISLNPGQYIMFRFLDNDYGGSDHALGYDDLYLNWTVTGGTPLSWGGIEADQNGYVDTGLPLGWIFARNQPWLWSYTFDRWIYATDPGESKPGFWVFIPTPVQVNPTETVATPLLSPLGGTFTSSQTITLSTSTVDATIRYSTDGSNPSDSNGTLYTSPFTIDATSILRVIAYKEGMTSSSIASQTYTITELTGNTSYWSSLYPVTGGWELDPSVTKKAGIPPNTTLTPHTGSTTFSSPQTITDREFTGTVTVNSNGVRFIRCKFTAGGGFVFGQQYATGTTTYVLKTLNGTIAELVDCELYGGSSSTFLGSGHFTRCLIAEGNDGLKVQGELTLIECVLDGVKRSSSSSHSDVIQSSTNAPSTLVHRLYMDRCWVDCYNRRTNDLHNACIMMGSYGAPTGGITGHADDCWFGGGNYKLNRNGGTSTMTFQRNRFDRNHRYGISSDVPNIDSTNIWADSLQPVSP